MRNSSFYLLRQKPVSLLLLLLFSVVLHCHGQTIKDIKQVPNPNLKADLAYAMGTGDPEVVRKAVEDGADINQKGRGGQTPLVNSVLRDNAELVKLLLELGADPTIPEESGYTAMHVAGFQARVNSLKVLARHRDPETGERIDPMAKHPDGFYPIHRACKGEHERHAQTVQVFLNMGVPLDLEADNGETCEDMTTNKETKKVIKNAKQRLLKKKEKAEAKAAAAAKAAGTQAHKEEL